MTSLFLASAALIRPAHRGAQPTLPDDRKSGAPSDIASLGTAMIVKDWAGQRRDRRVVIIALMLLALALLAGALMTWGLRRYSRLRLA